MKHQDTSSDAKTLLLACLDDHLRRCDGGLPGLLFKGDGLQSAAAYVKIDLRAMACLRLAACDGRISLTATTYRGGIIDQADNPDDGEPSVDELPAMDPGGAVLSRAWPPLSARIDLQGGWRVDYFEGSVMTVARAILNLTDDWRSFLFMKNPAYGTSVVDDFL